MNRIHSQTSSYSLQKRLWKSRKLWMAIGMIAAGGSLGLLLASPLLNLTISIVGILICLVTIATNPLNGLLLWMVSNPFGELYINIPLGQSIPDLSPSRFCVAFLSILLLAQVAIRRRKLAPFTTTDLVGILFMMGLGFSIINETASWQNTIQGVFDSYYVPMIVYFFAKNLISQRRDIEKVLGAMLFFGIYAALYAIYENQTENILFIKEEVSFTMYKESGLHVLRGLLSRSDHFGALFSMVIPVTFYLYLRAQSPLKKFFYATALGILFLATFFTYKRTTWFSIVVIFFVIQLFYKQFRRLFFVLLIVFLIVLGLTWTSVSQSTVVTSRIQSKRSTMEGRTAGWNAALELWADQPFFGYGFGNYETVAKRKGIEDTAIENAHLNILFGAGLFGFAPYVTWLALLLRNSIQLFRQSDKSEMKGRIVDRELYVIFWGAFLGYIINYAMTTTSIFPVKMVFFLLSGALVGSQTVLLPQQKLDLGRLVRQTERVRHQEIWIGGRLEH